MPLTRGGEGEGRTWSRCDPRPNHLSKPGGRPGVGGGGGGQGQTPKRGYQNDCTQVSSKGGGGSRDVLEGGEVGSEGDVDLAGTPPPLRVPRWSPRRWAQKSLSVNPLEGAETKFWLSASNIGRGGGGGGLGGSRGTPPPPEVHGHSNTSLGGSQSRTTGRHLGKKGGGGLGRVAHTDRARPPPPLRSGGPTGGQSGAHNSRAAKVGVGLTPVGCAGCPGTAPHGGPPSPPCCGRGLRGRPPVAAPGLQCTSGCRPQGTGQGTLASVCANMT